MNKCPGCHCLVDFLIATHWNGESWHRSCAVKHQIKKIDKLKKKLKSPGVSQVNHVVISEELIEAEKDLMALREIEKDENKDTQALGKVYVRRGFGSRVDTHKLLEKGEINQKQIDTARKIKELYG